VIPAAVAALLAADIAETVLIQLVGQLVSGVIGSALAPELLELQQESFKLTNTRALDPATSVEAFIKGHRTAAASKDDVGAAGYSGELWQAWVDTAGNPPGVGDLLTLLRRGVIPEKSSGSEGVSYEQGVREGLTKNKWTEPLKKLMYQQPSPESALQALLEGQTDEKTARKLYAEWGGQVEYFDLMFNSQGSAPTPLEAAEMARRGIIPWNGHGAGVVSYEQAFLEGPWRNKWLDPMRSLAVYVPPPRTVTAMVREGAMTDATALKWFTAAGLDKETAASYLEAAHHQRTAATKELAKADILALLIDELIEEPAALAMLEGLGYAPETANFEIEIARFRAEHVLLNQTLTRLRTLYIAHKVDKQAALTALDALGLSPGARDKQLAYWDQARANNVTVLTAAQVGELVKLEWLSFSSGVDLLMGHGYSAADAQLYLLAHLKIPPGKDVPPGVTISPS
jgi:hypothetical protein